MNANADIVADITKAKGRKSLFHFTRASGLGVIAHFDALLSSSELSGEETRERRVSAAVLKYEGHSVTLNAHLRIPDSLFAASTTPIGFRAHLDKHVFFWPTARYCLKMLDTYTRREPDEPFAVLEFDAYSLLMDHFASVKLSKYDSGSSPRFPASCTYRKGPEMFLPLGLFKSVSNSTVPVLPSQIQEVLIERKVNHVSRYLQAVWAEENQKLPESWSGLFRSLKDFRP